MLNRIIGAILLIIGTTIGGGMLALPMATAGGGFLNSLWLFLAIWGVSTLAAFFLLEVNLWLPEHTNMISMAKETLGSTGQLITWLLYLILLYALLCAYIAGGGDLSNHLLTKFLGFTLPAWSGVCLFVLILGAIVHNGIALTDWANRIFMTVKIITYILLVAFFLPHIQLPLLSEGHLPLLTGAMMVVVTSFGYSIIIPSLRVYLKSDVKTLRLTIAIGSLIPLVFYTLWDMAVQGSVPRLGDDGLIQMAQSGHSISDLTLALHNGFSIINHAAPLFTSICVTTSFLGVSLCLSDFLADGIQVKKEGKNKWLISAVTFLPPLIIVLFYPGIFIKALSYAGLICVLLLILLPTIMTWCGRYIKNIADTDAYQVWGGRWLVILEVILSCILVAFAVWDMMK